MWRLKSKLVGVGVCVLWVALVRVASVRAAEALFSPDCTTDNLLARKAPVQRQDLRGNPCAGHRRGGGARGGAVGLAGGGHPRHARRLGHLRPRSADVGQRVLRAGRRQRHLQDLRLARRNASELQGDLRGRHRTTATACAAAWSTSTRRWCASCASARGWATTSIPSPSSRPTAARRRRSRRSSAPSMRRRRACPTVPWWKCDLVGQRRRARASRCCWRSARMALILWGIGLRKQGDACRPAEAAPPAVDAGRDPVLRRVLELRVLPLPKLHSRLGHLPLLHRLEVLPRAVLRPTLRVRLRR